MDVKFKSMAIKEYMIDIIKKAQIDIYSKPDRFGYPVEPEEIINWINKMDSEYLLNIFYPVIN